MSKPYNQKGYFLFKGHEIYLQILANVIVIYKMKLQALPKSSTTENVIWICYNETRKVLIENTKNNLETKKKNKKHTHKQTKTLLLG